MLLLRDVIYIRRQNGRNATTAEETQNEHLTVASVVTRMTRMSLYNRSVYGWYHVSKLKGPYTLTSFLVPVAGASFWCQLPADE